MSLLFSPVLWGNVHAQQTNDGVDLGSLLTQLGPGSISITDGQGNEIKPGDSAFNIVNQLFNGQLGGDVATPQAPLRVGTGIDNGSSSSNRPKKSIFESMSKVMSSPSSVVVDPKSSTVTLHLENLAYDSVPLDFVVRRSPTQLLNMVLSAGAHGQSRPADAPRSLADWIQDIPRAMSLGPRESRDVTLRVAVPPDAPPGTYTTDVTIYYKPVIKIDESTDLSNDVVPKFFADTTVHGFPGGTYVVTHVTYTVPKERAKKRPVGTH